MTEAAEELKKIDGQDYVMVLDIMELYTSCIQLSLYILRKKNQYQAEYCMVYRISANSFRNNYSFLEA